MRVCILMAPHQGARSSRGLVGHSPRDHTTPCTNHSNIGHNCVCLHCSCCSLLEAKLCLLCFL